MSTTDPRGKKLERWYLIDIERALGDEGDREEAIVSAPRDLVLREDFGRGIKEDYSTTERQCATGVFPLWLAFDMPKIFHWMGQYTEQDPHRINLWNRFYDKILNNIISYTLPVIVLKKSTPKEAVCTVFEKVNTGGVALNVFELLTATFAGDKTHKDFRLNDDWKARKARLAAKPVLRAVENTDFLQAITLLASRARREQHLAAGKDPSQAPGITCKRKDILRLTLAEYLEQAPKVEAALLWAAGFLAQEHIFLASDLPYQTQLVPLAAIRATLGSRADEHAAARKLQIWYWRGVLGELYGGTTETRFARDLEQVVPWIRDGGPEPATATEANFQASRLLTLRTRNSAAYKGIYALLMREGCMDWAYRQPIHRFIPRPSRRYPSHLSEGMVPEERDRSRPAREHREQDSTLSHDQPKDRWPVTPRLCPDGRVDIRFVRRRARRGAPHTSTGPIGPTQGRFRFVLFGSSLAYASINWQGHGQAALRPRPGHAVLLRSRG